MSIPAQLYDDLVSVGDFQAETLAKIEALQAQTAYVAPEDLAEHLARIDRLFELLGG